MDSLILLAFSIAISVVLAMYCANPITQIADRNVDEKPCWVSFTGEPKITYKTIEVKNVLVARIAEFKRKTRGFLLMITVTAMPSSADSRIAAAPPYISIPRKTKVSATVMRPLTRGIRIAIMELAITIKQRKKNRPSRLTNGR